MKCPDCGKGELGFLQGGLLIESKCKCENCGAVYRQLGARILEKDVPNRDRRFIFLEKKP